MFSIPNLRLKADLTLLFVAIVWGSAFVVQRLAALHSGVFVFNGLRFLTGAAVLFPFAWKQHDARRSRRMPGSSRKDLAGVALVGTLLFAGAAFQQAGLQFTTAGNAGFITGLYVVLIPILLALGFRQAPRPVVWPAALLAAAGLFLLSTAGRLSFNPGDGLELLGAGMWALHVIAIGYLVQRLDIWRLSVGQYLICGALSLVVGLSVESGAWNGIREAWWAIAYTGVLSVGLGYTLQAASQRYAPPADAAIILSLEAVFAALLGWLLLGENLAAVQLLGCALILTGILLAQAERFIQTPS